MTSETVFLIEEVSYTYPNGVQAIKELSAAVPRTGMTLITGPNGAGKSTLLLLLDGLIFPDTGKIIYMGTQLSQQLLEKRDFASRFRREVGLMFQEPDVQLFCSRLKQDIAYSPKSLGLSEPQRRVRTAARAMQLENLLERPPHSLSWGQKKRAALATVLAGDYQVLLLDEPGAGLDSKGRELMLAELRKLLDQGKTLVVVAHDDPDLQAMKTHEIVLQPVHEQTGP